jgi:hypothetical protein
VTKFWVFFENWPKVFSSAFQKYNNFQFCEICGYKKRYDKKFFSLLSFVAGLGFGIRDGKNQDPGSGINIPDPQH